MTQARFLTELQRQKRYDMIPFGPETLSLLFMTNSTRHIPLQDGSRVHPNQHLGNLLRDYILLLIQTLDKQTQRVDNSVFPLCSVSQGDTGASTKQEVQNRIEECDTLQQQLRTFKGVWVTNESGLGTYDCYSDGPAQWVDTALQNNNQTIIRAQGKINEQDRRLRQLQISCDRLETEAGNARRSRGLAAGPPSAMLSYADIVSMKPGGKGRHNMSNKEWRKFVEESEKWFNVTIISRLPQTRGTRSSELRTASMTL